MPLGGFRLNSLALFQAVEGRVTKTITANGNAQVDTAQSKFNGASALFDGTGDYLSVGSHSDFSFGTGDFTVEFWVRHAAINDQQIYIDFRSATTDHFVFYVRSDNKLEYYDGNTYTSTVTMAASTWYHLAVVRSGTSLKIYRDGTEVISATNSTALSAQNCFIGIDYLATSANSMNGHIDEIRVSNIARYTAAFTAPTLQFSNDANTRLLLHCDGTDASTYFEDDSGLTRRRTITANYNAQISTAQSKFGSSSLLFDGAGDSITITPTADFAFANQDFTVEFWARWTSLSGNQNIMDFRPFNANGPYMNLGFYNGNTLYSYVNSNFLIQGAVTISTNTWYHVAISRSGTSTRLFFNGTQVSTTATDSNVYRAAVVSFGDSSALPNNIYGFPGYLDEIRVSKSARYTANFTPSTTAFTVDENTTMLLHCEGTNASTTVTDDIPGRSMNQPRAIGNAQISTAQSQFGGSSLLLDGTGDYLQLDSNLDFGFGSGDFTIECWARKSSAAQMVLFDTRSASTQVSVYVESNAAGNLRLFVNGAYVLTSSNAMSTNTWTHLAITRSDTTTRFFINGTVSTNTYTDTNNYGTSKPMVIGASWTGGTAWNGYLDEIRVSKSCRYTSTFTPSSTAFTNDVDTKLLLHCDGTNASTVIRDDNSGT